MRKDNFKWMVLLSAMTIVGMSAYYSIFGISSLFAGKRLFAGIMSGSLEFGKIVTTTHLTRNWKGINKIYKLYFVMATIILIVISSAGIYSYLTDAYQMTTQNMKVVNTQLSSLDSEEQSLISEKELLVGDRDSAQNEIKSLRDLIENNETRKSELYEAMNVDTTGTVNWNASIWRFNKDNSEYRDNIEEIRNSKNNSSTRIREIDDRLKQIWSESGEIEASDEASNIGPLKKLSELFNVDMDKIVKFFILIIIIVFDPLGILLIVQFNRMTMEENNEIIPRKKEKKEKIIYRGIDIENDKLKEKVTKPIIKSEITDNKENINDNIIINSTVTNIDNNIAGDDVENKPEKIDVDKNEVIVNVSNDAKAESKQPAFGRSTEHKGVRVK